MTSELPADWGSKKASYPLLRFNLCPLLTGRLASSRLFYTLQPGRRLLLVVESISDQPVCVPAGHPVGFVTKASVAEVLEAKRIHTEEQKYKAELNKKRKRDKNEQAEREEYIESEGENTVSTVSLKRTRMGEGDEHQLESITRTTEAMMMVPKLAVAGAGKNGKSKRRKRRSKKMRDKERWLESRCKKLLASSEAGGSSSNSSSSHSGSSSRRSSINSCQSVLEDTAAADVPALVPKTVVALANNERLIIDTNASFMTTTKTPVPRIHFGTGAGHGGTGTGGILCLDVETVSDGAFSQFSQLGAVLSIGGQTSTFGAQVERLDQGWVVHT